TGPNKRAATYNQQLPTGPTTSSYPQGPTTSSYPQGPTTSSYPQGPTTSSYHPQDQQQQLPTGPTTSSYPQDQHEQDQHGQPPAISKHRHERPPAGALAMSPRARRRGPGRPRLPNDQAKTSIFAIRLTPDERSRIEEAAYEGGARSASDWAR